MSAIVVVKLLLSQGFVTAKFSQIFLKVKFTSGKREINALI